jgi:hypothetical protein
MVFDFRGKQCALYVGKEDVNSRFINVQPKKHIERRVVNFAKFKSSEIFLCIIIQVDHNSIDGLEC